MKSSEARPLSKEELTTLLDLFQRWALTTFPYHSGCSEESDVFQTYDLISDDAEQGFVTPMDPNELAEYIGKCGETSLP